MNLLRELSDSVRQLTQLRSLGLGRNALSELPDWLGRSTELEELDLREGAVAWWSSGNGCGGRIIGSTRSTTPVRPVGSAAYGCLAKNSCENHATDSNSGAGQPVADLHGYVPGNRLRSLSQFAKCLMNAGNNGIPIFRRSVGVTPQIFQQRSGSISRLVGQQ